MMLIMDDLEIRYGSRKSFYSKAKIVKMNGRTVLFSYNTLVAEIKETKAFVYNVESNTTIRHIKEFLLQNGFDATTKKQIIKDYFTEEEE